MDAAGTGLISILSGRKNMKRFLLGVTVLSSVIGAGAVAAFYGHDYLAQQPAPAAAPPVGPARDLTPQPLALAEEAPALAVHEPASSNPFAREAVEVQRVSNEEPVAEVDDTFEQTANQLAADTAADDIPPADAAAGAATAASDPFAPRAAGRSHSERRADGWQRRTARSRQRNRRRPGRRRRAARTGGRGPAPGRRSLRSPVAGGRSGSRRTGVRRVRWATRSSRRAATR